MKEIFPIAPAGSSAMLLLLPIAVLLVAGLVLVIITAIAIGRGSVEVSPGNMRIKAPLYGRSIPLTSLIPEQARVIDISRENELRPKWRTNGIGLPNYAAGWFKLQNGEKALLLVTDKKKVLYLPTRDGYSILLSAVEPERLLALLKNPMVAN